MGDFDGKTFATDKSILCDAPGSTRACPADGPQKFEDKEGDTLYPIDSAFGFHVIDFEGAVEKERGDGVWGEGFAGNIEEQGDVIGMKISNAKTDVYKVQPPLGTWCAGLGATSVKCSTEHYSTMEHVLSCHEVLPYFFAEPDYPFGQGDSCEELDNDLYFPDGTKAKYDLSDLEANDNTNLEDIVFSRDYSVTKKDDGKVLYRWGSLIKRPNDVRLYAKLALPDIWKERDSAGNLKYDLTVFKARLIIEHWITNNPNDQIRAEDLENEGATGRKPGYQELPDGSWESIEDCVEGDGNFIPAGTVLKHPSNNFLGLQGSSVPEPLSEDLTDYYTNAWYTTVDRDPFEWSYLKLDKEEGVNEYVGTPRPYSDLEEDFHNVELVSGPRWRLKANKFGQDIPGLEIPTKSCSAPPYTHDKIKYNVGERTTTVVNLLDWDVDEGPSPLKTSKGWVDVDSNLNVVTKLVDGMQVSTNGLPMTEDFDLAIYIKGDRKPTALFTARLEISYEGEEPQDDANEADFAIVDYGTVAKIPVLGVEYEIFWIIQNDGPQGN